MVALWVSGQHSPPLDLVTKIERDLQILRDSWQDSLPVVKTRYYYPWSPFREPQIWIRACFDSADYYEACAGNHTAFNELLDEFSPDTVFCYQRHHPYCLKIVYPDTLHLRLLVNRFLQLQDIRSIPPSGDTRKEYHLPLLLRNEADGSARYFFVAGCGDLALTYYCFAIDGDSARLLGRYATCFEDSRYYNWAVDIVGDGRMQQLVSAYEDSLRTHRPPWVYTADSLLMEFKRNRYFRCERDDP